MKIRTPLLIIISLLCFYQCSKKENPLPSPELTRNEKIKECFKYDGSHFILVDAVKKQLRDPKSFEHDKTTYDDDGVFIDVNMHFRSKNGFGGINQVSVVAETDILCNVISFKFVDQ